MDSDRDNKGRFTKGNKGKPKGAKDHRTRKIDELTEYLISDGVGRFMEAMDEMDNQDYAKYYIQLIEYVMPKLARQTIDVENGSLTLHFDKEDEAL